MTEAVIVGLITAVASITAAIVTSKGTQNKVQQELSTQNALQNLELEHIKTDIAEMKADIRSHNAYGKKFVEMRGDFNLLASKAEELSARVTKLEEV